jgi:alpha-tubulin suppressor-like RCC1 family protein
VSGNWTDVVYVAAGADFTCAVRETTPGVQTLWCWGNPANGRLGRPSTNSGSGAFFLPDQVGTDTNWASVTAGDGHACGLKTTGEALCWGVNSSGQLGTGDFNGRTAPAPVTTPVGASSSVGWEMITTSGTFTCGLADGELYCWGSNAYGQVEAPTYDPSDPYFIPTNTSVSLPTQIVAGLDCTDVAVGALHACGICSGELWCWGYDASGQAGYCPEVDLVTPPMQVGTRTDWLYVGAGSMQSSANRTDGTLWSWGANSYGQLGDSSVSRACAPVAVN